jgi:hypothetical protein
MTLLRNRPYAREDEPKTRCLTSRNHAARRSEAEPHWYGSRHLGFDLGRGVG